MLMRRVLNGSKFEHAVQEVKKDLPVVMMNDYRIWPLYDVLCFSLIPRHTQALSSQLLDVAWCTYISSVVYSDDKKQLQ